MNKEVGIAINAGSSSLKIGIFDISSGAAKRLGRAIVSLGEHPRLKYGSDDDIQEIDLPAASEGLSIHVISSVLDRLLHGDYHIGFVGHRVAHGGLIFKGPTLLTGGVMSQIGSLTPMAPLHQPQALNVMDAVFSSIHPSFRRHRSTRRSTLRNAVSRQGWQFPAQCTTRAYVDTASTASLTST